MGQATVTPLRFCRQICSVDLSVLKTLALKVAYLSVGKVAVENSPCRLALATSKSRGCFLEKGVAKKPLTAAGRPSPPSRIGGF